MLRLVATAFALLLAGAAQAQAPQFVRFPSAIAGRSAAGPEILAEIFKPEGEGRFPAIVLAHSCAGINHHTHIWARKMVAWGYVVLAPDSFGPRGRRSVCEAGNLVSGDMRVADIAGALDYLNAQPFVIRGRLGLIGHSHGGWTAMRAVQQGYDLAARGLRAAVAYYPWCTPLLDREVAIPLLILTGDRDDWTPADRCRALQAAGFAWPGLVEAIYYPNAWHSFDVPAPDRTVPGAPGQMHHLSYDFRAADDAEARTKAFFARYLR